MLVHDGKRWRTECDRCRQAIEVVGEPDKRKHVELGKAARFLESLGWNKLHRAGRGDRVDWWCRGCVVAVAAKAKGSIGHSTAGLDMNPKPQNDESQASPRMGLLFVQP